MFRKRPVGWRYESYRHSLAAHGMKTVHGRSYFAYLPKLIPRDSVERFIVENTDGEQLALMRVLRYRDLGVGEKGKLQAQLESVMKTEKIGVLQGAEVPEEIQMILEAVTPVSREVEVAAGGRKGSVTIGGLQREVTLPYQYEEYQKRAGRWLSTMWRNEAREREAITATEHELRTVLANQLLAQRRSPKELQDMLEGTTKMYSDEQEEAVMRPIDIEVARGRMTIPEALAKKEILKGEIIELKKRQAMKGMFDARKRRLRYG